MNYRKLLYRWKQDDQVFELFWEPHGLKPGNRKGRSLRLYHNGEPALGGQWHHNVRSAFRRSDYVAAAFKRQEIKWLEDEVRRLQRLLAEEQQQMEALRDHYSYFGNLEDDPTDHHGNVLNEAAAEFALRIDAILSNRCGGEYGVGVPRDKAINQQEKNNA